MLRWLVPCTVPLQTDTQNVVVESSYATLGHHRTTQLRNSQLQHYGHSMWVGALRSGLYNLYITRYFPAYCSTQTNNFAFDYFSLLTETRQGTMKCFSLKYFYIKISSVDVKYYHHHPQQQHRIKPDRFSSVIKHKLSSLKIWPK